VVLGSAAFLREHGVEIAALGQETEELRREGATAVFVAVDGALAGVLTVADPLKPSTAEALAALKAEGLRVVMLSGDNRTTAEAVARRLGIDESKVISTVAEHANTSAASIPLALDQGVKDGRIRPGQLLLMEAMGGGLTWGACVLRL
jgi:high-affinity K+ transport system ATPase subunit B